jgi:phenylacetate-CoA ligase
MRERFLHVLLDARRTRKQGYAALESRQRVRFAELVTFARAYSPYYRTLYQNLPEQIVDPRLLPVTSKQALMPHFDAWVTDRRVTHEQVRAFVDTPGSIGKRFLDAYTVTTTSGTTGSRGMFLLDNRSLLVASALTVRMLSSWLRFGDIVKILAGGARIAMVIATGGHFASSVAAQRLQMGSRWRRKIIEVFPVHTPMPELVARLNQFRPVMLAPYASMAALLADEQEADRLHISPALVVLAAEGLADAEYARIGKAFNTEIRNSYAATECPFLSYSCAQGWLHVNNDWVVVEPVDADYQPTPPGQQSHTVLISNLANRVQPILRYDLGDSVLQRPDPCPCGNPLPAIRVQGRTADTLTFPSTEGHQVRLTSLMFATLMDRIPGVERFQIVQVAPLRVRLRLLYAGHADPGDVGYAVHNAFKQLLDRHGLGHVTIERADEPPEHSFGGKYRVVIPFHGGA